jgi:hypothetical protein
MSEAAPLPAEAVGASCGGDGCGGSGGGGGGGGGGGSGCKGEVAGGRSSTPVVGAVSVDATAATIPTVDSAAAVVAPTPVEPRGEPLPQATAEEVAALNALLNAQSTYHQSADVLRDTLQSLLARGHVVHALGLLQGENVLLLDMKDDVVIGLLEGFLDHRQSDHFARFSAQLHNQYKYHNFLRRRFAAALAARDMVRRVTAGTHSAVCRSAWRAFSRAVERSDLVVWRLVAGIDAMGGIIKPLCVLPIGRPAWR